MVETGARDWDSTAVHRCSRTAEGAQVETQAAVAFLQEAFERVMNEVMVWSQTAGYSKSIDGGNEGQDRSHLPFACHGLCSKLGMHIPKCILSFS